MSNPDRRVPNSNQPASSDDGFFVDITPPEFGQKRNGKSKVRPPTPAPEVPNVPGQPSFVERRATPAKPKDSSEFFFRGPRIDRTQVGKTETEVDTAATDEVPTVPDLTEPSVNESSDPTNDGIDEPISNGLVDDLSETITQDIPAPATPTETFEPVDPAEPEAPVLDVDERPLDDEPEVAHSPEIPTEQLDHGDQAVSDEVAPEEADQQIQLNEVDAEDLSPAQLQLAEMRAMLSKMKRPGESSADLNEPATDEHPIKDALLAKIESDQLEETSVEVLPPNNNPASLPLPPPPAYPYFPTPEQKKAHARFLPPEPSQPTGRQRASAPGPEGDRYGLHRPSLNLEPELSQSFPEPDDSDLEVTGQYDSIQIDEEGVASASNLEDQASPNSGAVDSGQRSSFFENAGSNLANNPQTDRGGNISQEGSPTADESNERRRPQKPSGQQNDYQVLDRNSGEYDYDHEYYSANKTAPPERPGSRIVAPGSPRLAEVPPPQSRSSGRRPEIANQSRAGDAVDRLRVGRVIFLLLIAAIVGGLVWAGSTGLINFGELLERVSGGTTLSESSSTNTSLEPARTTEAASEEIPQTADNSTTIELASDDSVVALSGSNAEPGETVDASSSDPSAIRISIRTGTASGGVLAGVPVEVIADESSDVVAKVATSRTGSATYFSEDPGCYRVSVSTPPGWVLTNPAGGTFAAVCGDRTLSPSFNAIFRESATTAPSYCEIEDNGAGEPRVVVGEEDDGFADSYTLYNQFEQKLAETKEPTIVSEQGQGVLEWLPNADFEFDQISALSATVNGEESLTTACENSSQ